MGWHLQSRAWTEEETERLAEMFNRGASMNAIGAALGRSRNAVSGQLTRLRVARDPRIPAAAASVTQTRKLVRERQINRLADLMADGRGSLAEASAAMDLPRSQVEWLWSVIVDRLGWQAA